MGELLYRVSGTNAVGVMHGDDDSGMGSNRYVLICCFRKWVSCMGAMTVAWAVTGTC